MTETTAPDAASSFTRGSVEDLIRSDVDAYLRVHERKDMLRLLTAGSVDDGKSTLIGRLLYDTKMIYEDQLAAVKRDSRVHGTTGTEFDPALLTDGLKAEREQGITIDVAYRYFSTDKRSFIIADTPGHEQYTRNMATGASTCDLAIILIDARHGVLRQTKRHSFIASLLGIRHFIVAVNKMDLVDFNEERFLEIRRDYEGFASKLEVPDMQFIPMSALRGENVVERGASMPWYQGPPLLAHLESVHVASDRNLIDLRLPIQNVLRPDATFRGFCGTIASGILRPGDAVMALPSRQRSRVKRLVGFAGDLEVAFAPLPVTVVLEDEIDVSRGSMLVHPNNTPHLSEEFDAVLVWMSDTPLVVGTPYLLKAEANLLPGSVSSIRYAFDVNTLHRHPAESLGPNDIGRVTVSLHRALAFDAYAKNRKTGAFILIDRLTNATMAAGMIIEREHHRDVVHLSPDSAPVSQNIVREASLVTRQERARIVGHQAITLWLTGLSGSGKSTVAKALERRLVRSGALCMALDGDNVRHGLNRDLGFSSADRAENIRRVAEVARLLNEAGVIVVTSFISPYRADREDARRIVGAESFVEVFVDAAMEDCERRDPKGLYRRARTGEIADFTGVSSPYETPGNPDLRLDSVALSADENVARIVEWLKSRGTVPCTLTLAD